MPLVRIEDHHHSEDDRDKLTKKLHFNLELRNNLAKQTIRRGSCIALTFSRYKDLIVEPYVSH